LNVAEALVVVMVLTMVVLVVMAAEAMTPLSTVCY
jgi:hypothetical protein